MKSDSDAVAIMGKINMLPADLRNNIYKEMRQENRHLAQVNRPV